MKVNSKVFIKKTTYVISTLLILTSLVAFFYSESFLKKKIQQFLILKPNTTRLELWMNPPVQLYRSFYFFHVQNPKEFLEGAKPFLVERGPYVYREIMQKRNIQFIDKDKLKYNPVFSLYFEPSLSIGNESDIVRVLNVPFAGFVEKSLNIKIYLPMGLFFDYYETKLFVSKSIREIISGYYDPLMHMAKEALPNEVMEDKFGLLLNKNGTEQPELLIRTGETNSNDIAKVIGWNGKNKLDFWNNENANTIQGTDGSFTPPLLKRDHKLFTFSPELCRSYSMTYLKDNEIDGIPTYGFHLSSDLFSCSNMKKEGFIEENCLGNGVFNLSNCQNGVSSFLSQPHFLNADNKFVDSVKGLKPDKKKHDFIIHYEPISGTPIEGNVRLQINIFVFRNKNIEYLKMMFCYSMILFLVFSIVSEIKPVLFPFFWFDEKILVDHQIRNKLLFLNYGFKIIRLLPKILLIAGILLFLVQSSMKIMNVIKKKNFKKKNHLAKESSVLEIVSFKNENNLMLNI